MTTYDPAARHNCEHCAEGVPLDPDGIMHTHTGVDEWHPAGHVSPCFSAEAYELVQAQREARAREVVIVGCDSLTGAITEALARRGDACVTVVQADEPRVNTALSRLVENVKLRLPELVRATRAVCRDPFANAGYFADTPTRRRGRR